MTRRNRYPVLTVALFSASTLGFSGESGVAYHYFPAIVELKGTLCSDTKLGPPGYGETPDQDARVKISVLKLDRPINVNANPDNKLGDTADTGSFSNLKFIQLFWDKGTDLKHPELLLDKHIVVRGSLEEALAPMQFTTVTMSVSAFVADAARPSQSSQPCKLPRRAR